jgi:Zn-dependent M28 family amino/carboxypeptidase
MMEAMRILKASGLPMRRTVRLGLWTGEEEGLLGSRAFVDKYFFSRPIMQTKAGHGKLSTYFNLDNGTGLIRGVYMQGNKEIMPIFESWMSPFKSMGMTTLAPGSVSGTDHVSFDYLGLPAFQFIQDPIQYDAKTHHTTWIAATAFWATFDKERDYHCILCLSGCNTRRTSAFQTTINIHPAGSH